MIVAVVLVYVAWRLLTSVSKTGTPAPSCHDNLDPSLCGTDPDSLDSQNESSQDIASDPVEVVVEDVTRQVVRIIWNYPADICLLEDEGLLNLDEIDGECEIIDLARQEKPKKRHIGLRFLCKIPHLGKLLARHCRQPSSAS